MNQLTAAHIEAERRLRQVAENAVRVGWAALPDYSDAGVERFNAQVLPVIAAAQRNSAVVTSAYMARFTGKNYDVDVDEVLASLRNGVAPEEVYRRPFVTVWTDLKEQKPYLDAVSAGLAHAMASAAIDVQLAMRQTVTVIAERDSGIYGYERVPNGGACDLCLIASTQRYHSGDLMPIHNRCGCSVSPILTSSDRVVNSDLYGKLSADGSIDAITASRAATRVDKYTNKLSGDLSPKERLHYERLLNQAENTVEIAGAAARAKAGTTAEVVNHGELGPVLVNADHEFTLI